MRRIRLRQVQSKSMRRDITQWYSERLYRDMPIVSYGHFGPPVLMLPTAAADFLEYERFQLLGTVSHWLENGKAKAYSVNSVNTLALLNKRASLFRIILLASFPNPSN